MALFSHPIPLYAQRCIYYVQWIKNFYFLFSEKKNQQKNRINITTGTAVMQRQTTLFWWNTISETKLKQVFRIETAKSTGFRQNKTKKRKIKREKERNIHKLRKLLGYVSLLFQIFDYEFLIEPTDTFYLLHECSSSFEFLDSYLGLAYSVYNQHRIKVRMNYKTHLEYKWIRTSL